MSTYIAFVLSLVWIALLLSATVLNYLKKRSSLFSSSLFVLAVYAITHFINVQWLMNIPALTSIKIHYLFFSASTALLGIGLFWLNRENLTHMMGLAIFLLGLEALLIYAVHIDRNVVALNFNSVPNLTDSKQWLLWDIQFIFSTINNVFVVASVFFAKVYQVPDTPEEGDALAKEMEDYVMTWKDSKRKERILEYSDEARRAYNHFTNDGMTSRTDIGKTFLLEAVKLARYEPGCQNLTGFKKVLYWLRS